MTSRLFDGEVIVITGAGSGVGRAAALRAAHEGAKAVVCVDLRAAGDTAKAVEALGCEALGVDMDVRDQQAWTSLVSQTLERWDRIDAFAGVAGMILDNVSDVDAVLEVSEEGLERIIGVNLLGTFRGLKAVLQPMIAQRRGSIVIVTSAAANIGAKKHAVYSAAKGGAQALARQAAIEYAEFGVRVNSVAPGPIDSPMMNDVPQSTKDSISSMLPLGRFADPVEVAEAVLFLCSNRASFITGVHLPVDGGLSAN